MTATSSSNHQVDPRVLYTISNYYFIGRPGWPFQFRHMRNPMVSSEMSDVAEDNMLMGYLFIVIVHWVQAGWTEISMATAGQLLLNTNEHYISDIWWRWLLISAAFSQTLTTTARPRCALQMLIFNMYYVLALWLGCKTTVELRADLFDSCLFHDVNRQHSECYIAV